MNRPIIAIITLQQIKGFGRKRIIDFMQDNNFTINSPEHLIERLDTWNKTDCKESEIKALWSKAENIVKKSELSGIKIIDQTDAQFPKSLLQIPNPPIILHIRGNVNALSMKSIAIVGTRDATEDGLREAFELSKSAVKNGFAVVSGLATGIDTAAHTATVQSKGITIAVIAQGIDTLINSKNDKLIENILQNDGAIVSEFHIGIAALKWQFVDRDRLQSGLSLATFVIETSIDGGTMHTANFCLTQGKQLFVMEPPEKLKNNIQYAGNKKLLSEGAIAFSNPLDFNKINAVVNPIIHFKKSKKSQSKLLDFK